MEELSRDFVEAFVKAVSLCIKQGIDTVERIERRFGDSLATLGNLTLTHMLICFPATFEIESGGKVRLTEVAKRNPGFMDRYDFVHTRIEIIRSRKSSEHLPTATLPKNFFVLFSRDSGEMASWASRYVPKSTSKRLIGVFHTSVEGIYLTAVTTHDSCLVFEGDYFNSTLLDIFSRSDVGKVSYGIKMRKDFQSFNASDEIVGISRLEYVVGKQLGLAMNDIKSTRVDTSLIHDVALRAIIIVLLFLNSQKS